MTTELIEIQPSLPTVVQPQTVMERLLVAVQSGLQPELLEKFMELAERQERREAEKAYNEAFAKFKANPPSIIKDKKVDYTTKAGNRVKYEHATIGKVVSEIITGLAVHGLSHSWSMVQSGKDITVTCRLKHFMGHFEESSLTASADESGGKNPIQAISSANTYLQRYTLQAVTGLAILEVDDDGRGADGIGFPPTKKKQQKSQTEDAGKGQGGQDTKPDKWQTYLEQWLDWIDKFTDANLDQFTSQWEAQGEKAITSMPEQCRKKMLIAKNEMVKHLMEKQEKKA